MAFRLLSDNFHCYTGHRSVPATDQPEARGELSFVDWTEIWAIPIEKIGRVRTFVQLVHLLPVHRTGSPASAACNARGETGARIDLS